MYMSARHQEGLAHLLYGIDFGGGFVALTGEVGTGKTTLCHCLLQQLPKNIEVALILNSRLNVIELVATICDELGISYDKEHVSLKSLIDLLNQYLLAAHANGKRTVLLIDEAQNLSLDVLEQVRLLTNLETSKTKLLRIILVGQPELKALLARQDLRQLNQRITARYHLLPLSMKKMKITLDKPNRLDYSISMIHITNTKQEAKTMTQKDVKAYMLNEKIGTKNILYVIPVQIDATWVWYDRYNGYGKAATSKEAAQAIVQQEIIPICKEA